VSTVDTLWFHARAMRQRLLRAVTDRGLPPRAPRAVDVPSLVLSSSTTALWTHDDPLERPLVAGKVHNLRVAARAIDGAFIAPGAVWSFWGDVGPPWRAFGFVDGRELREGCLVPSVGGGLCQLSNALYACALDAGLEIVERHAHTAKLVGLAGAASSGARDATVFWSYVDLRFRVPREFADGVVVRARVVADRLEVRFTTKTPRAPHRAVEERASPRPTLVVDEHACDTCNQHGCETGEHARSRLRAQAGARASRTAYLVDEHIPELARMIAEAARGDVIAVPLPGVALRMPQYAWDTHDRHVVTAATQALRRSRAMRALAQEGARRVRAQLDHARAIAGAYVKHLERLGPSVDRVVVAQSLAPFLWNDSALGGRALHVFAHRMPLFELHARLDAAALQFPEDPLLRAFRAPQWLVDAEREVLTRADRVITAHLDIARVLGRSDVVPWSAVAHAAPPPDLGRVIVFPGPSSSRKGAHAVRDLARTLASPVALAGSDLMPDGFWAGVNITRVTWPTCLRMMERGRVRAVVQPALVEDQPRRLLDAIARGVPVVTTAAAGLPPHALVREVAFGVTDSAAISALPT
jgi:hypothetical protein